MNANVAGEAVRMTIASGGETEKLIKNYPRQVHLKQFKQALPIVK